MSDTDEDFVKGWLKRRIGTEFVKNHPRDSLRVQELLLDVPLPTCDPSEGQPTGCTCGRVGSHQVVRFYLSKDEWIQICIGCDSWAIFESAEALRRRRRGER